MIAEEIIKYCTEKLKDVVLVNSWGEEGIFYNPQQKLKRGVYILTIKEKDGTNDKSSNLNRDNIFRVNLGIRKATFKKLFGEIPKRPAAGCIVHMEYDFTATDKIIPHPVYAWMGWISVLNPSAETFEALKPLIEEAYMFAKEKFDKRK